MLKYTDSFGSLQVHREKFVYYGGGLHPCVGIAEKGGKIELLNYLDPTQLPAIVKKSPTTDKVYFIDFSYCNSYR